MKKILTVETPGIEAIYYNATYNMKKKQDQEKDLGDEKLGFENTDQLNKIIDDKIKEIIELPIEIGDTILTGKFKNHKVIVKDIGKDEKGQPTINGKTIMKIRIPKIMPAPTQSENIMKITIKQLDKLIENKIQLILNEGAQDKLYFDKYGSTLALWLSWNPGSGTTKQIRNLNTYLTDKSGDDHFDSMVPGIIKWSQSNNPIKKVKNYKLFEIPVYDFMKHKQINSHKDFTARDLSIWGGTIEPIQKLYMMLSTETSGITIVSFFKTKGEADGWIRSSN